MYYLKTVNNGKTSMLIVSRLDVISLLYIINYSRQVQVNTLNTQNTPAILVVLYSFVALIYTIQAEFIYNEFAGIISCDLLITVLV